MKVFNNFSDFIEIYSLKATNFQIFQFQRKIKINPIKKGGGNLSSIPAILGLFNGDECI